MKYLIIPERDIQKLEKERSDYYQGLKQENVFEYLKTSKLTGRVWDVTHRRYKNLSLWNLILTKLNLI